MTQNTAERVQVTYQGELIAAGIRVPADSVFWTAIRLDPTYDAATVHDKLVEIRHRDGVHFDWRGVNWVSFPPAYTVTSDDSLTGGIDDLGA